MATPSTSSVKVAVRVRPMAAKELLANSKDCVEIIPGMQQIIVGGGPSNQVGSDTIYNFTQKVLEEFYIQSFTFDYLFDENSTQEELYNLSVSGLVDRFLEGFNATILAYGQTGSGKTYSMGIGLDGITHANGADLQSKGEHLIKGIVPRAITAIFTRIAQLKQENDTYTADVAVSFMELYNEELVDLLNPRPKSAQGGPTIREDGNGKIVWVGLCDEPVTSSTELLSVLQKGTLCRTTGSTDMNATSSRSHAIFTVTLRQSSSTTAEDGSVSKTKLTSKFHFVDLAGSERLKRTNAEGDRKKEGISINQGLLALGNVISALGDETRRTGHVPYRDSKLTRMLQDSLGGNSQTLMLACISPSDLNYGETVNTLHYANRARNIKNKVAINQDWGSSYGGEAQREIKALRLTISKLRTEIAMIRAGGVEIKAAEQESQRNISGLVDETKLQYHQRRERDHLAEIDALKTESANSLFQLDRFHFLSIRLAKQVRKLIDEVAKVSIERDQAIADKCRILKRYAKEIVSDKRSVQISDGDAVDIQDMEVNSPPGKRLKGEEIGEAHTPKRSRTPDGIRDDMTPMIKHYLSTIAQLRLQLSECEDKLAWQYEAMSKLGQKSSSQAFEWPAAIIKDLKVSVDPSTNRMEKIMDQADTSERPIVAGEKKLLEAIKENIQLRRGVAKNDFSLISGTAEMSNLAHEVSLEEMKSITDLEQDVYSTSKDEQAPDIYMLINKLQNDIVQHEALAENIQKREQEYARMQKAYESKLAVLQHEMEQTQLERDLALKKMGNGSKQQKFDVKTRYEEAQRRLDSEISDTRRKMGENSRMQSNSKSRAEKLTGELKATIAALKSKKLLILGEKMRMIQELRTQTQKHRDSNTANLREISKLRRKEKNASEMAKRLERSNQLQRLMLKKRSQEVIQTQQKLKSIMQSIRRSSTPTKISKTHMSGCTSPIPRNVKSRNGRGQLTGPAMNELLASINSPVRVSVSQSLTARPDIDLRAQLKKQMVDKELNSTIQCRKTQKTLQNYKTIRNRLIEEQKELIAERKRVVEANYRATKIYDDKSPQYMDERVQSIDLEIASIDHSMIELEDTLRRHSGVLDSSYLDDEGSHAVDLNWENAMNLLKSLDRNELEATIGYFLEDVVALRTLEDEYSQELESKEKVVSNLKQQLEEVQESFFKQVNTKKVIKPSSATESEESMELTPTANHKPLLPRLVQPVIAINDYDGYEDTLKTSSSVKIPTIAKRSSMRPISVSPSQSISENLDNLSFRSKSFARPQSPIKEISRPISAVLPGLRVKDKDDLMREEQHSLQTSNNNASEEEPKLKKRYDLLTMGASGDVFQRLAHSHTQASQAKVISRSSIDKDSLMQDVSSQNSQESKRKSLSEMEQAWNE